MEHAGVPANQLSTGLDAVTVYASKGTAPTTSAGQSALKDAVVSYGHAFSAMFFIAGGLTLVAGIAAFVLLSGSGGSAPVDADAESADVTTARRRPTPPRTEPETPGPPPLDPRAESAGRSTCA
jgi:hypothetical protein